MFRKIFITSALFMASTGGALAQVNSNVRATYTKAPEAQKIEAKETRELQRQENKLTIETKKADARKDNATKEIDRRLESLTKLTDRIKQMTKLTETQKTELTSQVSAQITSLTALKGQIAAETDSAKLLELKKQIKESYRIYMLFIPKVEVLANADKILNMIDKMRGLIVTAEARIAEAKTAGKDTASAEAKITEAKTILDTATTDANGAIGKVIGLIPSTYTGDKTPFQEARKLLESARTNMVKALPLIKSGRGLLSNTNVK